MSKNLKIFLIVFLISLPFWWGVNVSQEKLEDFLFWKTLADNPNLFMAQIAQEEILNSLKPIRNWQVEAPEIAASSAISVFINQKGEKRILFEKNSQEQLPIASLTKLMTASVALENYDLSKEIRNSQVGRTFPAEYFLYPLLIESNNDAALILANDYDEMSEEIFVALMNLRAKKLNLENTYFANPTGLDPENSDDPKNVSTAQDLVKLTEYLLEKPLIWEILALPKFDLYGPELINTNKLLEEIPEIIGGKTGYTIKAQGCLLLVLQAPKNRGVIINIVLGSQNRFEEMEKIIDWVNSAHKW